MATRAKLTLSNVCNALAEVKYKWFKIGIQLGVPHYKLEEFKKEDDPLTAVINYWLKGNVEGAVLSWESIVTALKSPHVGERGQAIKISQKYCTSQSNSHVQEVECQPGTESPLLPKREEPEDIPHPQAEPVKSVNEGTRKRPVKEAQRETEQEIRVVQKPAEEGALHVASWKMFVGVVVVVGVVMMVIVTGKILYRSSHINECHLIKDSDSESLDKVLQKVDEDPEKICSHLNLKNCIKLKQENKLKPFHFAESYLSQHEEPCWEEIVAMLCGMDKRKLAKQVANRHDVNYELKCPNST